LLDSDELKLTEGALFLFQTERNDFSDALHQSVEALCLRMAAMEARHRGDKVTILIAFYQDREFALRFHAPPPQITLAWTG
jgi:hypothetical protein